MIATRVEATHMIETTPLKTTRAVEAQVDTLHPLEQYAQTYILERQNIQRSKLEVTLRLIFALFGAAWGVSWIEASANAAVIFTEGLIRETFAMLFKFGIVTTVGADGLWIMLTLGKDLGTRTALEQRKSSLTSKLTRSLFSIVLSSASIIAPVYSAFKYNAGVGQMLAVVIFVVKFGFSLFAYSTLIDQTTRVWRTYLGREKALNPTPHKLKKQMLQNLNVLKKDPTLLSEFPSGKHFIQYILLKAPDFSTEASISLIKKRIKMFLQPLLATAVGVTTFTVDTYIITEVFEKILSIPTTLAFPLAVSAAIPTFVVMTLTTYRTLGEWFNLFLLKKSGLSVFEHCFPTLNKVIRLTAFSICLLAPTAAAYITHDTLTGKIGNVWVWTAVIFMIAGRDLFAYFSLSQLLSKLVLYWHRRGKTPSSKNLDASLRVEALAEKIQALDNPAFERLIRGVVTTHSKPFI